jgi:hypothetical protein
MHIGKGIYFNMCFSFHVQIEVFNEPGNSYVVWGKKNIVYPWNCTKHLQGNCVGSMSKTKSSMLRMTLWWLFEGNWCVSPAKPNSTWWEQWSHNLVSNHVTHKISDHHLQHNWQWLTAITPLDSWAPTTMGVDWCMINCSKLRGKKYKIYLCPEFYICRSKEKTQSWCWLALERLKRKLVVSSSKL